VQDILAEGREGANRTKAEFVHIAQNLAMGLAWAQSATVIEVTKQR
jgi:hypothetical protein